MKVTPTRHPMVWTLAALVTACGSADRGPMDPEIVEEADPVIQLDRTSFALGTRQGNPDPDPFEVQIVNVGEGQLTGLEVDVEYPDASVAAWLAAELDGTTAPAMLRLQVRLEGLDVGQYEAQIHVRSSVADQSATVGFVLDVQPPRRAELHFGADPLPRDSVIELGEAVVFDEIEIRNSGPLSADFTLRIYRSADAVLSQDDRTVAESRQTITVGGSLSLPGISVPGEGLQVGPQYLIFVLDPDDEVEESDEENNAGVVAVRVLGHELDVVVEGAGTVSTDPQAGESGYAEGYVELTARPAAGWVFDRWSVDVPLSPPATSAANPLRISVAADVRIRAIFRPDSRSPSLEGQVSSSGRADLVWSFDWPCIRIGRTCQTSSEDRYEVAMADLIAGTPFRTIHTIENTRTTPYRYSLRVGPGQWAFQVRAVGSDWASAWSEPIVITLDAAAPPAPPSDLRFNATLVDEGVRFDATWRDNADNEDSYLIQVAWNHPDFAGGAPLPANTTEYSFVTDQIVGQRLYVLVQAVNDQGSVESNVAFAEIPVRNGTARFHNQTDYPVFSLVVGGTELLPGASDAYQRGQGYQLDLAPGTYDFRMLNGIWDGTGWNALYVWSGTITVEPGGVVDVTFPDPSATDLMTRFSSQHTWSGGYFDQGLARVVSVTFRSNGQYTLVVDGTVRRTGTYRIVQRAPAFFLVEIQLDGHGLGTLNEALNTFQLQMGGGLLAELLP